MFVNPQRLQCRVTILGQIDLVDADRRLRPAALNGDQKTIDEPRPQWRRLDGHDMDDEIDVRGDQALDAWIERVRTREDRSPGKNLHQAPQRAIDRLGDHPIANRERAALPPGDLRRDHAVDLTAVEKKAASSAGNGDDDRAFTHLLSV